METVLVRWSEIGTKSRSVAGRMLDRLHDRLDERLEYEGIEHGGIERLTGRIVVRTDAAREAAAAVSELPGVASASPALETAPEREAILAASDRFEVGETFGVDANTAGEHPFDSEDLNREVGARVQERAGAAVDLDDPETWLEVDVREGAAYLFTERHEGPGGYPVGSQAPLAALISGGIDSPVAAHAVMTRGADVVPVYGYNKPLAAGDHVARFEAALGELVRFHPAKDWYYYRIDMEPVNDALLEVGQGRMVLHRIALFGVAARIARREDLRGIVTGESMGQKSSQTATNLAHTAGAIDLPVHRPLLTARKEEITERARRIGTFEAATVDAACRTLAPKHPATSPERVDTLKDEVGLEDLVDAAWDGTQRVDLQAPRFSPASADRRG